MAAMSIGSLSRRDLLAGLVALAGAAAAGRGVAAADAPERHMLELGKWVLRSGKVSASAAVLEKELGQSFEKAPASGEDLHRMAYAAALDDFRHRRTVRVDGVLLSETEARAFAYFALKQDVQDT